MTLIAKFEKLLLCSVIALFGVMAQVQNQAQAQDTMLTIHAVNYPPYEIENPGSDGLVGFDVEVVIEAFKRVGQPAQVKFRPWKRIVAMAKIGQTAAILSCGKNEARNEFINYSDPISTTSRTYAATKGFTGEGPKSIEDGKGFKVISVGGYSAAKDLDKANVEYYVARSDEAALNILLKRDFDLFYTNREFVQYVAVGLKIADQLKYFDTQLPGVLHLCFSRKWPDSETLHDMFNKGLAEIRADGTWDAIHGKYQ